MAEKKPVGEAVQEEAVKAEGGKKEPIKARKDPFYTVEELLAAPIYKTVEGKDIPKECVVAAFKGKKKEEMLTVTEAKEMVKKFMGRKVK